MARLHGVVACAVLFFATPAAGALRRGHDRQPDWATRAIGSLFTWASKPEDEAVNKLSVGRPESPGHQRRTPLVGLREKHERKAKVHAVKELTAEEQIQDAVDHLWSYGDASQQSERQQRTIEQAEENNFVSQRQVAKELQLAAAKDQSEQAETVERLRKAKEAARLAAEETEKRRAVEEAKRQAETAAERRRLEEAEKVKTMAENEYLKKEAARVKARKAAEAAQKAAEGIAARAAAAAERAAALADEQQAAEEAASLAALRIQNLTGKVEAAAEEVAEHSEFEEDAKVPLANATLTIANATVANATWSLAPNKSARSMLEEAACSWKYSAKGVQWILDVGDWKGIWTDPDSGKVRDVSPGDCGRPWEKATLVATYAKTEGASAATYWKAAATEGYINCVSDPECLEPQEKGRPTPRFVEDEAKKDESHEGFIEDDES